jgi:hypothetical protein
MFTLWNMKQHGNFYFDYFKFGAIAHGDIVKGIENFNSEDTSGQVYFDGTTEYLAEYQGATGVVKGSYVDDWVGVQFRFNTTVSKLKEMAWDYFEFKMTVDFTGSRTSWDGMYSNKAGWTYSTDGVWRIYRAEKAGIITQFGSLDNFYKAITSGTGNNDTSRMFTLWNMHSHGNFYFDYVKLGSYAGAITFDSDADLQYLRSGTNAKWLESVTGNNFNTITEYGVIEYNHTTTAYDGIRFNFNNANGITVDDWNTIKIRIRILRGQSAGGEYGASTSSGWGSEGSFQSAWKVGGVSVSADALGGGVKGWSTLTITKDMITATGSTWQGDINAFWADFTSENGACLAAVDWLHASGSDGTGWIIQIDEIVLD